MIKYEYYNGKNELIYFEYISSYERMPLQTNQIIKKKKEK